MTNDKSIHENDPPGSPSPLQWFDEIEKNETAKFSGPVNSTVGADGRTVPDPLVPCYPHPGTEGTSNPYAKNMPLLGLNLMNDVTPTSNSQNPVPVDTSVYRKGLLPISDSDFLCCEGNTDFGYSVTPHSVVNASSKFYDLQNPYVGRELVSATGSAASLNSIQHHGYLDSNTSRPQVIDNFTSDGHGTHMSWPTLDGSCLTLGLGCKPNDLPVRNVGFDSERDVIPRSNIFHSQNTNRGLHLSPDVATRFSSVQKKMQQVEKQQQFHVPGNRNVFLGGGGNCNQRYFDANNGIQGYLAVPILPVDNRLPRLPDSGLSKVNELTLSTSLPLSDQSQRHQMESSIRNTSIHNQSWNPFAANEGVAAHVAERGLFPEEFRKLVILCDGGKYMVVAGNPHQPEVASAVLSSTNSPGYVITGQEIPTTKVNRAVQPSRPLFGTSVKRAAAETLTATSHAEASKTRRTHSSTGLSVEAPFMEVSSLNISYHDASFASQDHTSPSLLHQAKSTTLNTPLSQFRSALPPEVKGLSSLIQDAPSRPLQARSAPLLPPSPRTSLPPQVRSIPSVSSLSQTSLSLPLQAKSTPLLQSFFQTSSSLAPQVKDISSLPSLSHTASSIQTQASSITSLPPTTSSIPTKTRGNEFLQHQSQMAHFLLPPAKTTTSHPRPYMNVPSLLPIANTISPPILSQNGHSWPPQAQTASSLPSQHTTGRPLRPKYLRDSPLPQKPRTALPPRSQIASSLSSDFSVPSPLPPQSQIASPVPRKCIAPPAPAPLTTAPVTQKVNARPLPPQRQTGPVDHIKWNAGDEDQLIGHKCLICKRDLAFTPEGPVSMPPIAPMVAVLPCGHTFHDHCLHLITPKEEVKNPPCIPCAIGES